MDAPEVSEILRSGFVSHFRSGLGVKIGHRNRHLGISLEVDVGIVMARTPLQRLRASHTGDPKRWMRFLERGFEGIDHAKVVVLAFPSKWTGRGPGLDYQIVSFLEPLPIVDRI